jgi:hypothetical protein
LLPAVWYIHYLELGGSSEIGDAREGESERLTEDQLIVFFAKLCVLFPALQGERERERGREISHSIHTPWPGGSIIQPTQTNI